MNLEERKTTVYDKKHYHSSHLDYVFLITKNRVQQHPFRTNKYSLLISKGRDE